MRAGAGRSTSLRHRGSSCKSCDCPDRHIARRAHRARGFFGRTPDIRAPARQKFPRKGRSPIDPLTLRRPLAKARRTQPVDPLGQGVPYVLGDALVLVSVCQPGVEKRADDAAAYLPRNPVEDVQQAVEERQRVLRQKQPPATHHAALAAQAQNCGLVFEIPGSSVPSVVRLAAARQRGMKADDSCRPPFLQEVAIPSLQP